MIILVNAEKPFHRFQHVFVTKGQKTFLIKLGKEQEFLSLCVSIVPLRSRPQDRIRHARDLLEEMRVRGNEKAWKRMRDLSDHDMNLSSGEEERKKADGAEASETPVQLLET